MGECPARNSIFHFIQFFGDGLNVCIWNNAQHVIDFSTAYLVQRQEYRDISTKIFRARTLDKDKSTNARGGYGGKRAYLAFEKFVPKVGYPISDLQFTIYNFRFPITPIVNCKSKIVKSSSIIVASIERFFQFSE